MASPGPSPAPLAEKWRLALYPHIGREVFHELLADDTEKGWDDIRGEVAALTKIVAALPAPARPTAEQIALVERRIGSLHLSANPADWDDANALTALLTAVTGKDTRP